MPALLQATRQDVRDRVESAALKLFVQKGYAGTSTRDIAESCGLTAGALYTHYPSKADLFAAVVSSYRERILVEENPLRDVLAHTTFPHDIYELAFAVRDLVRQQREYWVLWYVDVIEFGGVHFESALAPRALLDVPSLKKRFEQLEAEGTLRVDPSVAFVMVYMHLFNFFLVENIFRGNDHYGVGEDEAIKVMTDVFLHGMLSGRSSARDVARAKSGGKRHGSRRK